MPCPNRACDGQLVWVYEVDSGGETVYYHGECEYCGYSPPDHSESVVRFPHQGVAYANEAGRENEQRP